MRSAATFRISISLVACVCALTVDDESQRRLALRATCKLMPLSSPRRHTTSFRDQIAEDWELAPIAKCGSSSIRWYLENVLPTRNVTAAAAVRTQQMTWVRDPIVRFISGALEIMERAKRPKYKRHYDSGGRIVSIVGQWNESNAGVVLGEFAHYFVRGGAGLKFDGHLKPQFEHLEDMSALKHLGLLSEIFTDLDKNFGTNATEVISETKKGGATRLFKTMRQRSGTSWMSRALPVPALRELCLFYHADVCCLDRNFSERCASVGVECYANQTYERRSEP